MKWLSNLFKGKKVGTSTPTPDGKRWVTVRACVKCEEVLDENEQVESGGECPHCGNKSTLGLVCDTKPMQELR